MEHPKFETLPHGRDRLETELGQFVTRPAPARIRRSFCGADLRRRFGDHHPGAHPQEGGAALGYHGWSTEGTGQEAVEGSAPFLLAARLLRPLVKNPDPVLEPQAFHRHSKEPRPASVGLQEHQMSVGPERGHRQSGQTTTGAQIDQEGLREAGLRGQAAAHCGKTLGVS